MTAHDHSNHVVTCICNNCLWLSDSHFYWSHFSTADNQRNKLHCHTQLSQFWLKLHSCYCIPDPRVFSWNVEKLLKLHSCYCIPDSRVFSWNIEKLGMAWGCMRLVSQKCNRTGFKYMYKQEYIIEGKDYQMYQSSELTQSCTWNDLTTISKCIIEWVHLYTVIIDIPSVWLSTQVQHRGLIPFSFVMYILLVSVTGSSVGNPLRLFKVVILL